MDRRTFLISTSAATTALMTPFRSLFALSAGTFTPLRRNVGYFTERGGTIGWLASPEGLAVVDSQYPESARNCLKGLRTRSDHRLDLLVNTHHHGDHTNGNTVFREPAGKIVSHKNVPILMKRAAGDEEVPALPDTTFTDRWNTGLGDEMVRATYYGPAHTGGDAVVYFEKANVVHMGDLMFNRMNPYTDRPAGASIHNWIKVLDTVREEYPSDAIYIFGHGNPDYGVTGSGEDLKVMRDYFQAMVEHVESGIEAGKSLEQITDKEQMDRFPDFVYADWWSLSQNLEVVYSEIKEEKWIDVN